MQNEPKLNLKRLTNNTRSHIFGKGVHLIVFFKNYEA